MNKPISLYIHIPFCKQKCSYCDFYSFPPKADEIEQYIRSLAKSFSGLKDFYGNYSFSTVYIGGGTPSLLGDKILLLMDSVFKSFDIEEGAEITAEVNPESAKTFLPYAKLAGINRLSFGIQAGRDKALENLGRLHNTADVSAAVDMAKGLGFENLSGDLMIGLPNSDMADLDTDIDFLLSLPLLHISSYILKAEKGTKLYTLKSTLPNEDTVADFYLHTCRRLENAGFLHYEVSNFAKPGFEGKHNLNYWRCKEYLGLGPGAHSFVDGRRFYYTRDIKAFMLGAEPITEGSGGTEFERFMLALRLNTGVRISDYPFLKGKHKTLEKLSLAGYLKQENGRLVLTDKGFLLSNNIITELTYEDI